MLKEGTVSIVIPVYNGEKWIPNMLATLSNLLYVQWEALFVDDGSVDKSADLIKTASQNDNRIKYYYKPNGGIASAREFGLEKANGDFICFWDQDDTVVPDILSIFVKEIGNADFIKCNRKQKTVGTIKCIDKEKYLPLREERVSIFSQEDENWKYVLWDAIMRGLAPNYEGKMVSVAACVWDKMFRVSFLREQGIHFKRFLDYEDDLLFMIDVMSAAHSFVYDERELYINNDNPLSESRGRIKKDRYIESFYEKITSFRSFMEKAVDNTGLAVEYQERFFCELQKMVLLWCLSNETGRGIQGRSVKDSVNIVRNTVASEKRRGIHKKINAHPLEVSVYGGHGFKRIYYLFRDKFLTFCMLHHMCISAVVLNKFVLHGRWHW